MVSSKSKPHYSEGGVRTFLTRLGDSLRYLTKGSRIQKAIALMAMLSFGSVLTTHAQDLSKRKKEDPVYTTVSKLFSQEKWDTGKVLLDEEVARSPKNADYQLLLGRYYLHKKTYDKARFALMKALQQHPNSEETKNLLIAVEEQSDRVSSAICYINELLEVNPYAKRLWLKKIDLYRRQNNDVEADRLLKRLLQIFPNDKELRDDYQYMLTNQISQSRKDGRIDEAIRLDKILIEENPTRYGGYLSIIDNYIHAGDFAQALVYANRGINQFPTNEALISKKIAVMESQGEYVEILNFIESELKARPASFLRQRKSYFLLEAAQNERKKTPASLYAQIFDQNPGNEDAFNFLFNHQLSQGQYEECVNTLRRHRSITGDSRNLDVKELDIYERKGDQQQINRLTHLLYQKYPQDVELENAYLALLHSQAKEAFQDEQYNEAIRIWQEVVQLGSQESLIPAQQGLLNSYVLLRDWLNALITVDELLRLNPEAIELRVKKADIYYSNGNTEQALKTYELLLSSINPSAKVHYLDGYEQYLLPLIKSNNEQYELEESLALAERWLAIDVDNQTALYYAVNLNSALKRHDQMLHYAERAARAYPQDINFQIKLAQALGSTGSAQAKNWRILYDNIERKPYHEPLLKSFEASSSHYVEQLLSDKNPARALEVIDSVLQYSSDSSKNLRYLKGLAYEELRQYDSAYRYQQYYQPSYLEQEDYKQHMYQLAQRSYRNIIGLSHMYARFADEDAILGISSINYARKLRKGRLESQLNYTGREAGQGIEARVEWTYPLSERFSTKLDAGLSSRFFAKTMLQGNIFYQLAPSWELEAALGFRRLYTDQDLRNLSLGIAKDWEQFRLSAKASGFRVDGSYLYSVFARGQYHMSSQKNYIAVLTSVGNSPDVDLLDNQLTNSFDVMNAMMGGGFGRQLSRNVSASLMGSWYNFQASKQEEEKHYKNFYTIHFQVNVSF